MPLVELYFNPEKVSPTAARAIAKMLPFFVADALCVVGTDGQLVSSDVEVRIRIKEPHDITAYDLEVTILAKYYPEREVQLETATRQIADALKTATMGSIKSFVYVLLAPAGFVEFGSQGGSGD